MSVKSESYDPTSATQPVADPVYVTITRDNLARLKERASAGEDAGCVLAMIGEDLAKMPCLHGTQHASETPAMMYPEWVACIVAAARKRQKLESLESAARATCTDCGRGDPPFRFHERGDLRHDYGFCRARAIYELIAALDAPRPAAGVPSAPEGPKP